MYLQLRREVAAVRAADLAPLNQRSTNDQPTPPPNVPPDPPPHTSPPRTQAPHSNKEESPPGTPQPQPSPNPAPHPSPLSEAKSRPLETLRTPHSALRIRSAPPLVPEPQQPPHRTPDLAQAPSPRAPAFALRPSGFQAPSDLASCTVSASPS
jgi:hypothetical protein